MLGNIDLLVCGNSDPGTSGILSPFGKIEGLYFNDSREPDDYEFAFKQDIEKIMKADGVKYIEITAENKEKKTSQLKIVNSSQFWEASRYLIILYK